MFIIWGGGGGFWEIHQHDQLPWEGGGGRGSLIQGPHFLTVISGACQLSLGTLGINRLGWLCVQERVFLANVGFSGEFWRARGFMRALSPSWHCLAISQCLRCICAYAPSPDPFGQLCYALDLAPRAMQGCRIIPSATI